MATIKKTTACGTPTKKGQLRSPTIKRPLSAPVTMQGWLHKQGSDGLMLWKKRWFVLSEYCLFYYKGQEEEKLLGSILLPSYRISPCSSEDRVFRKFSFKAEHTNMRTYYFAAESQQNMTHWMNALSLASILQESNCWDEQRSGASTVSSHRNTEDSDSGFHGNGTSSRQTTVNQTPVNCNNINNENNYNTCNTPNSWTNSPNQIISGYQPLYANAPPKPRRLNDSSSTERSPERNTDENNGRVSRMLVQHQDYNISNDRQYYYNAQHAHRMPQQLLVHTNNMVINNIQMNNNSNNERRTPDTYGRSNTATPCNSVAHQQKLTGKIITTKLKNSDYEDVYQNNPDLIMHQNHPTISFPINQQPVQYRRRHIVDANRMNDKRAMPQRPHSADFLEYDTRRIYNSATPQSVDSSNTTYYNEHQIIGNVAQRQQPRRPKSSLDILQNADGSVMNGVDIYGNNYWSEESYARKMRQSASYINPTNFIQNQTNMSNSSRATTPSLRQHSAPFVKPQNVIYDPRNRRYSNHDSSDSISMRNHAEIIQQQERRWSEYVESRGNMLSSSTSNQFVRSASARLPRQSVIDDPDEEFERSSSRQSGKRRNSSESSRDGAKTQQREESMKRLLEWKQRMLQSPLTRKNSGSSNRGKAQNELKYYKQHLLRENSTCDTISTNSTTPQLSQSSSNSQYLKASQTWDRLSSVTPDSEKWNSSNTMPESRPSSRRKHSDDSGVRSSTSRSKSQDGRRSASILNQNRYTSYSSDDEASGSGSVIGRDPLPPRVATNTNGQTVVDKPPPMSPSSLYLPPQGPILRQPDPDLSHKRVDGNSQWNLHMSAGELLGRTHEELVLLLIQLRRQSAGFCKAMEACHTEIEAQARLAELETPKRLEHLQKLEDLKRHLLDLEKQYEKGKPLVNLVDNMVKLGSLYRVGVPISNQNGNVHAVNGGPLLRERLEFNHKVQEQRLLAEERRDWQRLSPDHNQLQAKVAQLYRLDRLLQEESGTLYSLQQDKEMLERALGGLRHKLQGINGNPVEAERYRRQQHLLERELTRVRSILAHNSKKLEETVAENARLEQELVILRQKLQTSRRVPDSTTGPTTAALEAELRRVQTLVGDLQRQRQELSLQVRQLTEKSHSLSQQIRPGPTGVAGAGPIFGKKRTTSTWLETDLDSQVTRDIGLETPPTTTPCGRHSASPVPLYVNTDDSCISPTNTSSNISDTHIREEVPPPQHPQPQYCRPMDISEADDRIKKFYGIIPKDKPQEIKTVRIVKRESERRQRDRDRSGNIGIPITNTTSKRINIIPDDSGSASDSNEKSILSRVMEEPSESPPPAPGRSDSVNIIRNLVTRQQNKIKMDGDKSTLSAHEQLFGSAASLVSSEGCSPQLSPVYQSEAARQIVEEMASGKVGGKRLVPREKRRHHTVSSGRPLLRIDNSYSAGVSRDDLDMERALRPRLNAPDVVRSTLSRSDTKFSTETIDNLLGTPGKILIPERYVPESTPELSSEEQEKRLKKAESIRKMLSESTVTASEANVEENNETEIEKSSTLKKKVAEEKRQRDHLLQLSQIIAQQVMEKSKIVAGNPNNASTASLNTTSPE